MYLRANLDKLLLFGKQNMKNVYLKRILLSIYG